MTTTEVPTLDDVLILATRLSAEDKLRLIAHLIPQVARIMSTTAATVDNPLAELDDLIAESKTLSPAVQDSATIISDIRR